MSQKQEILQAAKQLQRLILSPQMQQSLHLLQMPIMELATLLSEELAQNPILDIDEESEFPPMIDHQTPALRQQFFEKEDEDLRAFIENTVAYEPSLYETLMAQAKEIFCSKEDLFMAEWIIGNIDENGFLTTPIDEIVLLSSHTKEQLEPILKKIQNFEPIGVASSSLQECLLTQLKYQGKETSLAFKILEVGFEDMLKNSIPALAKKCQRTAQDVYQAIEQEIASLDFHPGKQFPNSHYKEAPQDITPDIIISFVEDALRVEINKNPLPNLKVSHQYMSMLQDPQTQSEVKDYILEKLRSGKWLMRNLDEREQTLYKIAEQLLSIQYKFFTEPAGQLVPLTMKELAEKLSLHESTIARAVAHKYLSCPRGVFPIKSLFTNAYVNDKGEEISSDFVKTYLKEIITQEDKRAPLSDEAIAGMMKVKGVQCARRTIAKYRQELGIGNTLQRKNHS